MMTGQVGQAATRRRLSRWARASGSSSCARSSNPDTARCASRRARGWGGLDASFDSRPGSRRTRRFARHLEAAFAPRQQDLETGAVTDLAGHVDAAPEGLRHEGEGDVQTQAGAPCATAGRVEGVEDTREDLGEDAAAVVFDRQAQTDQFMRGEEFRKRLDQEFKAIEPVAKASMPR